MTFVRYVFSSFFLSLHIDRCSRAWVERHGCSPDEMEPEHVEVSIPPELDPSRLWLSSTSPHWSAFDTKCRSAGHFRQDPGLWSSANGSVHRPWHSDVDLRSYWKWIFDWGLYLGLEAGRVTSSTNLNEWYHAGNWNTNNILNKKAVGLRT